MPSARNDEQVKQMYSAALIEAVRFMVEKIYEENREIVERVVYQAGGAGTYHRTFDLKRAWRREAYGGGGTATGKFSYDPGKMNFHPSGVPGYGGVKGQLIEIVYHGLAGNFGYPPVGPAHASADPRFSGKHWAQSRDAWIELINSLGSGKIDQYMEQGFRHAGLNVIKNSGGKFISDGNN